MKVGIKGYSGDSPEYFEKRDFADYIELFIEPGKPFKKFLDYDCKYIIHAPHVLYGVNLASREMQEYSIAATKEALAAADALNSDIVIVHPGYRQTQKDTVAESGKILKNSLSQLVDSRIALENCPFIDDWNKRTDHYLAYDYASLRKFLEPFRNRICLDFSHANVSANTLHVKPMTLIAGLLKLDVRLFHLCDGKTRLAKDLHLPLFEGDFDLEAFKGIIKKSSCKRVTLETSMDLSKQKKEYAWLKQ